MLYGRYVDDTLVVIKPEDLIRVHNVLNNFDCSLEFIPIYLTTFVNPPIQVDIRML